jgi:hypothetical protein
MPYINKREIAAKKVEAIMAEAKHEAIMASTARVYAPGNSHISAVGYRAGVLTSYMERSPHDTRYSRSGESTTYYLISGKWKPWGWFNAWDDGSLIPDVTIPVHLDGGGYGKVYRIPRNIAPGQVAIEVTEVS